MSSGKRKAIVFDLDGGKKATKSFRGGQAHSRAPRGRVQYCAKDEEPPTEDKVSYMQPEILTLPFMIQILDECQIKSSNLMGKSKKEVINLFLRHITPKPQRKYQSSSLGKALSLLQEKLGDLYTPQWHNMVSSSSASLKTRVSTSSGTVVSPTSIKGGNSIPTPGSPGNRLKPPITSLVNTERKVIKLGGSSTPSKSKINTESVDKIDTLLNINKKLKNDSNELSTNANDSNGCQKRKIVLSKSDKTNPKKMKTDGEKSKESTPTKHSSVAWP